MRKMFSGEVFFALFLMSGAFKESIGFPVDLAAVLLLLTTLSILKRFYNNPKINTINVLPIILFAMFVGLVINSFFYSPNLILTQDKTVRLILLTTPAFVYPFFLFKSKESLTRFLITLAFVATLMSIFSLPMIFQRGDLIGFVGFNEGNYQGLGRTNGIGLVILLFLGILNDRLRNHRFVFLISTAVVLVALLGAGSRMPIVAVLVALFFVIFSSIKFKNGVLSYPKYYNKIFVIFSVLLIPLFGAYNQGFFNSIIYRFEVLLEEGGGASVIGRTERFMIAIDIWKNNLMFGSGFGSFSEYYVSDVFLDYPHNLFLELMSELGIVGLITFSALFLLAVIRFLKVGKLKGIRGSNLYITVAITFLVIFLNAMVSGDINGNRIMMTFISIMCLLPLIFKKEIRTSH